MTQEELIDARDNGRIPLPGGWSLVRCTDEKSPHFNQWFLEDNSPEKVWVAAFWDGQQSGDFDTLAFAFSLYGIE